MKRSVPVAAHPSADLDSFTPATAHFAPARWRTAARLFHVDWLRIGAFALLGLHHVGMVYVPWASPSSTSPPTPRWSR